MLAACGLGRKVDRTTTTETTTTTEKVSENDSISKTETKVTVSEAINDQIRKQVPESDTGNSELDSIVNKKMDQLLKQLNTQKRSGSNSYSFRFDEKTREIITEFQVGRTQDSIRIAELEQRILETESIEYTEIFKTEVKKVIRTLPWWIWAIAIWFFRKQILTTLAVFFPQLRVFTLYKRIMNPLIPNNGT